MISLPRFTRCGSRGFLISALGDHRVEGGVWEAKVKYAICGYLCIALTTTAWGQRANDGRPLSTSEERALRTGNTFKECEKCPSMVVVPSGSFVMGSPSNEAGRRSVEGPRYTVTFATLFAVGRFAVTFEEWDACAAAGGCYTYGPNDQGWGRDRRPVINIMWYEAQSYVAWLNKVTGKIYRLLSEAEREYVTRAGTTTTFWWGNSISTNRANYNGTQTYAGEGTGQYRKQTVPVDEFAPNPSGLYQVHGNVYEWVEDCMNASYEGAPKNGSARITGDCSLRVMRGGAWNSEPKFLRSAYRIPGVQSDGR